MSAMPAPSVLFVCLGNICRSPMAEGAMRDAAARAGIRMHIDSAGTGGWHRGAHPDPRAQAVAEAHGVDISHLRARKVRSEDFEDFDHIIAMDRENLMNLRRMAPPGSRAALSLILDHVPGQEGRSVADPYYGGEDGFARTWTDVSAGAEALLGKLGATGPAG